MNSNNFQFSENTMGNLINNKDSLIQTKAEENELLSQKLNLMENELNDNLQCKINQGLEIIKELKEREAFQFSEFDKKPKKHYNFILNLKVLRLLGMLFKKTLDSIDEKYDIFSLFSSKNILFQALHEINFEKKIAPQLFSELSEKIKIIEIEKEDIIKKSSKSTKEFNNLLIRFLTLQKEKFSLFNFQNNQIENIDSIYSKIFLNRIAINYYNTLNQKQISEAKKQIPKDIAKNHQESLNDLNKFEKKIQKRLDKITNLLTNSLYDSFILAVKIIFLSPFDDNFKNEIMKNICEILLENQIKNVSLFWLEKKDENFQKFLKSILNFCDIYVENFKFFNILPLHILYELNFLIDIVKINSLVLWDPLNIFSMLSMQKEFSIYNEPFELYHLENLKKEKKCFVLHYRDPLLKNSLECENFLMNHAIILSIFFFL